MRLRALPLLAAAAVTVVAASAASAAAAPVVRYTALSMQAGVTTPYPYPRGGGAEVFRDADVQSQLTPSSMSFSGFHPGTPADGVDNASVEVELAAGTTFAAGTSYDLAPLASDFGNSSSWNHLSCDTDSGSLTVLEAVVEGDTVTAFAADFSVACNTGEFRGSVRVNSRFGFAGAVARPGVSGTGYQQVALGETSTTHVTVTSAGSKPPLVLGQAVVDTDFPDSFGIAADTCSGRQLVVGDSCTVDLVGRPVDTGDLSAVLRIPSPSLTKLEFGTEFEAVDPLTGTYYPSAPQRVLDTRTATGGHPGAVPAGGTVRVRPELFGRAASAVVVNLTVTNPTSAGYVTAYAGDGARPATSSINFAAGQTVANAVTVPVAADGSFVLFNAQGRTDVIVDYLGYYARDNSAFQFERRGGGYHPTRVQRVLDTRTWGYGRLLPGYYARIPVRYQNDGQHIAALSVNVTVTNADAAGFVSTWDGATDSPPNTSTLNFTRGATVANAAFVPTTYCPVGRGCSVNATMSVYNGSSGPIDVLVDISGFYDDGGLPADVRYQPLAAPTRVMDTRAGVGLARFTAGQTQVFTPGKDVAGYDTYAIDTNVTGVYPTAPTFLTAWPSGFTDYPRPNASVINPFPGTIVANHATTEVGPGNRVNYYNNAGLVDLVVDVSGTFELFPATPPDQQHKARVAPTRFASAPPGASPSPVAATR